MTAQYQNDYTKQWYTAEPGGVIYNAQSTSWTVRASLRSKTVLLALKDRLTQAGLGAWTVLASSGKAGGGSLVADTNDNWLSVDDLVRAADDVTARSWVILKSPSNTAGHHYMTMDYVGADDYRFNVWFTKDVPDISSLSTDTRPPTTGNEWSHLGQYIAYNSTSDGALNMVLARAMDGSFFCGICGPTSSGYQFYRGIYMFAIYRPSKAWDDVKAVSLISTTHTSKLTYAYVNFQSLHSDGSQVNIRPIWLATYGTTSIPGTAYTDPWTGGLVSTPVWLMSVDSSKKCLRGALDDIFFGTSGMDDGCLFFKNEVVKAIKIGPFTCPMDQLAGII